MSLKGEFEQMFQKWVEESKTGSLILDSMPTRILKLNSYQKIINMGKDILPLIVEKLREGHFMLNHAMMKITGVDPMTLRNSDQRDISQQELSKLWIDWWEKNNNKEEISSFIAPWVLPKEEIPLYVYVNKLVSFSKIQIELPDCIEFVDTVNILKHNINDKLVEIDEIYSIPHSEMDYFGVILKSNTVFDDLAKSAQIKITLLKTNGESKSIETNAKIFRPLLCIDKIPSKISISDAHETVLPIHLKYSGFGDISLRITGTIDGRLVTKGGRSPLDVFIDELTEEGIFDKIFDGDVGEIPDIDKRLADIDSFKSKLRNKEYMTKIFTDRQLHDEIIDELKQFDKSEREKFMDAMYTTMQTSLMKKITNIISQNVTNKTHLDSGTEISTEIRAKVTNLHLKIFYRDLKDNVYDPLLKTMEIVDTRTHNTPIRVSIPIEIENIDETGAYTNVRSMTIGSSN